MFTDYPVVRHGKTQHAVIAASDTGPSDGSLWGFNTFCGLTVKDDQQNPDWVEVACNIRIVTCKRCQRAMKHQGVELRSAAAARSDATPESEAGR